MASNTQGALPTGYKYVTGSYVNTVTGKSGKGKHVENSITGEKLSQRQAKKIALGGKNYEEVVPKEARKTYVKGGKQRVRPPTSQLPRRSRVKNTKGEPTEYYQFKVKNLGEVATYGALLPPGSVMQVKARGFPNIQSPKQVTRKLKNGKTITYTDNRRKQVWTTLSGGLFRADEANRHLVMMANNASNFFSDMRTIVVMYRPGKIGK